MKVRLSDVQKTILKLAYENRTQVTSDLGPSKADVLSSEIFAVHYLAPTGYAQYSEAEGRWLSSEEWLQRLKDPVRHREFTKWYYGKMYNKNRTEINKALKGLEKRGWIEIYEQYLSGLVGAKLTEDGMALAQQLTGAS